MKKRENWYLGTFCEKITVNLALKNNQSNRDNENLEEDEDGWKWEVKLFKLYNQIKLQLFGQMIPSEINLMYLTILRNIKRKQLWRVSSCKNQNMTGKQDIEVQTCYISTYLWCRYYIKMQFNFNKFLL